MRWTVLAVVGLLGCAGETVLTACETPEDCDVPDDAVAVCLDKAGDGYCTFECAVDADCEVSESDVSLVCASFENEADLFCLTSCEDLADGESEADRCGPSATCRSTGGGSDNRKVCFPND